MAAQDAVTCLGPLLHNETEYQDFLLKIHVMPMNSSMLMSLRALTCRPILDLSGDRSKDIPDAGPLAISCIGSLYLQEQSALLYDHQHVIGLSSLHQVPQLRRLRRLCQGMLVYMQRMR